MLRPWPAGLLLLLSRIETKKERGPKRKENRGGRGEKYRQAGNSGCTYDPELLLEVGAATGPPPACREWAGFPTV